MRQLPSKARACGHKCGRSTSGIRGWPARFPECRGVPPRTQGCVRVQTDHRRLPDERGGSRVIHVDRPELRTGHVGRHLKPIGAGAVAPLAGLRLVRLDIQLRWRRHDRSEHREPGERPHVHPKILAWLDERHSGAFRKWDVQQEAPLAILVGPDRRAVGGVAPHHPLVGFVDRPIQQSVLEGVRIERQPLSDAERVQLPEQGQVAVAARSLRRPCSPALRAFPRRIPVAAPDTALRHPCRSRCCRR